MVGYLDIRPLQIYFGKKTEMAFNYDETLPSSAALNVFKSHPR